MLVNYAQCFKSRKNNTNIIYINKGKIKHFFLLIFCYMLYMLTFVDDLALDEHVYHA